MLPKYICYLINGCKSKTNLRKDKTNLKSTLYEDIEIQDIMKEFYLIILSKFSKMAIDTMLNSSTYSNILMGYQMMYHTLM